MNGECLINEVLQRDDTCIMSVSYVMWYSLVMNGCYSLMTDVWLVSNM